MRAKITLFASRPNLLRSATSEILAETGVDPDTRVKDLDEQTVSKLREYIDHNLRVEGELRTEVLYINLNRTKPVLLSGLNSRLGCLLSCKRGASARLRKDPLLPERTA